MRMLIRTLMSTSAVLALWAGAASAQSTKTFGLVAGVDFASWAGSGSDGGYLDLGGTGATVDKGSATGFLGGFYATIPIATSLVFEPELLYAGKGVKYDLNVEGLTGTGTIDVGLDYLSVPLLLRYAFTSDGGPYALLGPTVGFNLACDVGFSGTGDFSGPDVSMKCDDPDLGLSATGVTFGGVVGLGFQRGKFGLEGRYDWDFSDAFEAVDGVSADVNNTAWEILLRYQFK